MLHDPLINFYIHAVVYVVLTAGVFGLSLFLFLFFGALMWAFRKLVNELFLVAVLFEALQEARDQGRAPIMRRFLKRIEEQEK